MFSEPIDEAEWSKLYSATSQPFDLPKSGKIAVKVINHFGDEALKVYPRQPGRGPDICPCRFRNHADCGATFSTCACSAGTSKTYTHK